jgi:haloacetate dehalogenase
LGFLLKQLKQLKNIMHTLFQLPLKHAAVNGVSIAYRCRASGKPPLLLLHGHPQTHVLWHKVWDALSEHFSCVAMDLRGYGDSDKPTGDADHGNYSKRVMAQDAVALMASLGYSQFKVLAHDRGARVAHRLALDHPQAVQALSVLDIAPTLDMYRSTDEAFARAYYHWFFLIQPAPLPETLLGHDPVYYCRNVMAGRFNAVGERGFGPFDPRAMAEYERAAATLGWVHGVCEDYRASATIDLTHDQASRDAGQKLSMPLQVLWGEQGVVHRCFQPLALWQAQAALPVVGKHLPCGHYIAEEAPQALLDEALPFLLKPRA